MNHEGQKTDFMRTIRFLCSAAILLASRMPVGATENIETEPPISVVTPDKDEIRGTFVRREGNTFLLRHPKAAKKLFRFPILWLSDAQALKLGIDKIEVVTKLASLSRSEKPEDRKLLQQALNPEEVNVPAPKTVEPSTNQPSGDGTESKPSGDGDGANLPP